MGGNSLDFPNTRYRKEWPPGQETGCAERKCGFKRWAVYDGGDAYMGIVDVETGAILYAGGRTEYKESFLLSALDALRKRLKKEEKTK